MDPERSRHDLMLPYERPYSVALGFEWQTQPGLRRSTYLAAGLLAAAAGCFVAGATWLGLLVLIVALVVTRVALGWGFSVLSATWRKTRGWKARTELGDVRARRPHAPEHDPDVLHDEFAVAVDDDGYLHTWRFRPLDARERPGNRSSRSRAARATPPRRSMRSRSTCAMPGSPPNSSSRRRNAPPSVRRRAPARRARPPAARLNWQRRRAAPPLPCAG